MLAEEKRKFEAALEVMLERQGEEYEVDAEIEAKMKEKTNGE